MDWLRDHAWETWLGASILLTVAEMFSLDLVLIMLAGGGLAGMATAAIGGPVVLQFLVAAAVSLGLLAMVRPPMVRRLHAGPELQQGHDKLVGAPGIVTEEITGLRVGRVKLGGEIWSASPADDTITIGPGETVRVLEIRGATAYVERDPTIEI